MSLSLSHGHFCTEDSPRYTRVPDFYELVERKKENKMKEKITVTKYVHWFRETTDDNQTWNLIDYNPIPDYKSSLLMKEKYIKTDTITCEVEKK